MKVLIIDDEEDIRDILTFTLETEINTKFLYASGGMEAIELIKKHSDIDIIICDYNMPVGNGVDVYKYLLEKNINIPYVLCSSSTRSELSEVYNTGQQFFHEITKPYIYEGIKSLIKKYENQGKEEKDSSTPINKNESIYSTISLNLLTQFDALPSDIFVKVNDKKFVKVLMKGDQLVKDEIEKYKKKKINKLLIPKEDIKKYLDVLVSRIENLMSSHDKSEQKVLSIHDVIMETVRTLGLSSKLVRATKRSIEYTLETFEENKKFKGIARSIFDHPTTYLTKHSIALAYISTGIISKLPWDSFENRNKLVMASFLHDISIKRPDLNETNLDDEDDEALLNFKNHPEETLAILNEFDFLSTDVDHIILEHHERPDGSGFPKNLTAKTIKPLSSVFIFAHDVVDIIFKLEKDGKIPTQKTIIENINKGLYDVTNFKKSYEALSKIKLFEDDE